MRIRRIQPIDSHNLLILRKNRRWLETNPYFHSFANDRKQSWISYFLWNTKKSHNNMFIIISIDSQNLRKKQECKMADKRSLMTFILSVFHHSRSFFISRMKTEAEFIFHRNARKSHVTGRHFVSAFVHFIECSVHAMRTQSTAHKS
jgi:hypothetical protein